MKEQLQLKNHLKEVRTEANLSQAQLAEMAGVSRNTISSIETGQFNPTAKLALILCIALDKKFEELFYFFGGHYGKYYNVDFGSVHICCGNYKYQRQYQHNSFLQ